MSEYSFFGKRVLGIEFKPSNKINMKPMGNT